MAFNDIKDFYKSLSPEGTAGDVRGAKGTDKKSLNSTLADLLLSPGGTFYTYEEIRGEIEKYFNGADRIKIESEKDAAKMLFHAVGKSGQINLNDSDYWGEVKKIGNFNAELNDKDVSAFVIKNPFVSPAHRGTQEIDFFLNYTPSILAAQLTPYFELEFHIKRPIKDDNSHLDTPSVMRFLMGSRSTNEFNDFDKLISSGNGYGEKGQKGGRVSVSGMEMFLMPQTLTNMESLTEQGLGKEAARLVPVRPFVPFASIEGFDVTIQNAGAGAFAHKKASLKLKIHDKSRIGEMSEFFRGEVGFSQALIWTTYGWLAPRTNEGTEANINEYANFINENMLVRECWSPINSQFSFDQSGQVSVNMALVSSAAKTTYGLTVSSEVQPVLENFRKAVQWIAELKKQVSSNEGFSISVTSEQVLNAASTNGIFKDIKDMEASVSALVSDLRQYITEDQSKELEEKLKSLGGQNSYENIKQKISAEVAQKFSNLARTSSNQDPFLPLPEKKDYFPGARGTALINQISSYISEPEKRNKAVEPTKKNLVSQVGQSIQSLAGGIDKIASSEFRKTLNDSIKVASNQGKIDTFIGTIKTLISRVADAEKDKTELKNLLGSANALKSKQKKSTSGAPKKLTSEDSGTNVTGDIKINADVVSFGKLFMSFVVPSIYSTLDVDEIQVYFYGLNKSCGPMSGMSIAEFPIDVNELARAYRDAVLNSNSDVLGLNSFLKLVIETQIVNKASVAYGMNRFYKIVEENGTRKLEIDSKDKDTRDGIEKWVEFYGPLKPPVLEMYIESGERGARGKDIIGNLKKASYRSSQPLQPNEPSKRDRPLIMKIHIYDRSNNPHSFIQKIINNGGDLEAGDVDSEALDSYINGLLKVENGAKTVQEIIEKLSRQEGDYKKALNTSGISDEATARIVKVDGQTSVKPLKSRKDFKEFLTKSIPSIVLGTNGTMILSANVASKTEGTMGSINLMNSAKGLAPGRAGLSNNGLEEGNGLPLRVVPVQVTMTTMGIPTAQLYQTYFIDFNTGTSLDNIYNCSQLQHSIAPGKFTTSWTFIYTDGYGKFGATKSVNEIITGRMRTLLKKFEEATAQKPPVPTVKSVSK